MGKPTTSVVLAMAAIALGALLTGCGSGADKEAPSASSSEQVTTPAATSSSAAPPSPSAQAAQPAETIADYLKANGIKQTIVKRGQPGAPQLNLPMPPGWKDVGADTPEDAYGAIYYAESGETKNPTAVVARMVRLGPGNVDQAKLLELAPNALKNRPGFEGPATGSPAKLGGFDASQIAGTLVQDGQTIFVARKTVVIPTADTVFVLALDAQGLQDQQQTVMDAMSVIDADTTIEP